RRRVRVSRRDSRRSGCRVPLSGRVRDYVGIVAARMEPRSAQHAPVLGADAPRDRAWRTHVQLRTHHTRLRYPPLQAPVGRAHGSAGVAEAAGASGERIAWQGGGAGVRGVAASALVGQPRARPARRSPAAMVVTQAPPAAPTAPVTRRGWRAYPPVESPLSLSTIVSAVSRAARAPARARSQLMALLCERFGARRALLYASGTDALTEAIRIACTGRPPTVALPAFACYDLVTAAVGADARVLSYDIGPTTLQPEWDSSRAAVRSGPAAVVVASLFGFPIDWDA